MKISPLGQYTGPDYPTRSVVDDHPELLALVPKRWQASPAVLTALGTLCLLSTGVHVYAKDKAGKPVARVAPVFQHGEGRAWFGCVAINPPVVLSEEDTRKVIIEEAKRAGIDLSAKGPELSDIMMENHTYDPGKRVQPKTKKLQMDGVDVKHRVAFEYVSEKDAVEWSEPSGSTADLVDPRNHAQLLQKRLPKTKQAGYYAVFYDPFETPDYEQQNTEKPLTTKDFDAMRIEAGEKAHEQLRMQVRDFVKWLKAQGAI